MKTKNKKYNLKKTITVFLLLIVATIFSGIFMKATVIKASDDQMPKRYKYYTTICLESGTTLWDIANEYAGLEYDDPRTYIQEVININHLSSADFIKSGETICIPYYSEEYK